MVVDPAAGADCLECHFGRAERSSCGRPSERCGVRRRGRRQEATPGGRPDGDGFSCEATQGRRGAVCVPWTVEEGGLSVSAVREQVVRCPYGLRGVRLDGGFIASSGPKVRSSFISAFVGVAPARV